VAGLQKGGRTEMSVNCTGRGLQNDMGADRRGGGIHGVAQDVPSTTVSRVAS
jgi:hypothetical protein